MTIQRRNAEMVQLLSADFQRRSEPQFALANVISTYLALPGLRGFWPMSNVDENGDTRDLSGENRTLTNNNTAIFDFANLYPYVELDGSTQYLDRGSESGLDITGTESYIGTPGLTLGCWLSPDTVPAANIGFVSKYQTSGNQRSYLLYQPPSGRAGWIISSDGTATTSAFSNAFISTDVWSLIIGRFVPSTSVDIWLNNEKDTNTTSIPASIFNSSSAFEIGSYLGGFGNFDGKIAFAFLCASALSDSIISNIYHQTRILFNV